MKHHFSIANHFTRVALVLTALLGSAVAQDQPDDLKIAVVPFRISGGVQKEQVLPFTSHLAVSMVDKGLTVVNHAAIPDAITKLELDYATGDRDEVVKNAVVIYSCKHVIMPFIDQNAAGSYRVDLALYDGSKVTPLAGSSAIGSEAREAISKAAEELKKKAIQLDAMPPGPKIRKDIDRAQASLKAGKNDEAGLVVDTVFDEVLTVGSKDDLLDLAACCKELDFLERNLMLLTKWIGITSPKHPKYDEVNDEIAKMPLIGKEALMMRLVFEAQVSRINSDWERSDQLLTNAKELIPGETVNRKIKRASDERQMASHDKERPFTNSLGMKFVRVPISSEFASSVVTLASIWETRRRDWMAFVSQSDYLKDLGEQIQTTTLTLEYERNLGFQERNSDIVYEDDSDFKYTWESLFWRREYKYRRTKEALKYSPDIYTVGSSNRNAPVAFVSYRDAWEFCRWLTERDRKRGVISAEDWYSLPSIWEWSACEGALDDKYKTIRMPEDLQARRLKEGNVVPEPTDGNVMDISLWGQKDGKRWIEAAGGNDRDPYFRFSDQQPYLAPVGSYKPNALGIFDLVGNVSEWTTTAFNPEKKKVTVRGGSWIDGQKSTDLRSSYGSRDQTDRTCYVGFRVILNVSKKQKSP